MKRKILSVFVAIVMVISLLPILASADEPLPDYVPANGGYGEGEYANTYFVVGTNGYPAQNTVTELKAGTTLDLTYAENFTGYNPRLFNAQGDLTVIGDGQSISFNNSVLFTYSDGATITLRNLNWTTQQELWSNNFFDKSGTIVYEGTCTLPGAYSINLIGEITFKPKDDNSVLNIQKYRIKDSMSQYTGTVIFDGGKVYVAKSIVAFAIEIINGCDMTVSGEYYKSCLCGYAGTDTFSHGQPLSKDGIKDAGISTA